MCSASVVPIPSSTGWPTRSWNRRCRSAGSASPAVTVQRTEAKASSRRIGVEQRRDEPRGGEEQGRPFVPHQVEHVGGRRAPRVRAPRSLPPTAGTSASCRARRRRTASATDRQRSSGPISRTDAAVRLGRGLEAARGGASPPWASRSFPSCRARTPASPAPVAATGASERSVKADQPWTDKVRRPPRPPAHRSPPRCAAPGGHSPAMAAGAPRSPPDTTTVPALGVGDDRRQLVGGEHGRQRHGHRTRPQARPGTRPGRPARRRATSATRSPRRTSSWRRAFCGPPHLAPQLGVAHRVPRRPGRRSASPPPGVELPVEQPGGGVVASMRPHVVSRPLADGGLTSAGHVARSPPASGGCRSTGPRSSPPSAPARCTPTMSDSTWARSSSVGNQLRPPARPLLLGEQPAVRAHPVRGELADPPVEPDVGQHQLAARRPPASGSSGRGPSGSRRRSRREASR